MTFNLVGIDHALGQLIACIGVRGKTNSVVSLISDMRIPGHGSVLSNATFCELSIVQVNMGEQ